MSAFIVPGETASKDIPGVFLEPKGASTAVPNQNQRIPAGTYNLKKNPGSKHPDVPRLYNDTVPDSRAILIHPGNNYKGTEGCLLPGDTFKEDAIIIHKKEVVRDAAGNPIRDIVIPYPSSEKVKEVQNFLDTKGYENVRLHIFEKLTPRIKKRAAF